MQHFCDVIAEVRTRGRNGAQGGAHRLALSMAGKGEAMHRAIFVRESL
ncbi:hypothetical protein [Xanthomonas floridensis]|nr:hypothetical protein [Xanthomonas floridensis]